MGTIRSKTLLLIQRAARAYMAGKTIQDARRVCQQLSSDGLNSTMCYWNVAKDLPEATARCYADILDAIPRISADCYLSVKATAINFDFDLLRVILERARDIEALVHFDAMAPETVDETFALIAKARDIYPKLSCTLPGRWRRSLHDADRAVELGLRVRVVKGQWAAAAPNDVDPRIGFLNVIDRLGAERARHVAVATHDTDLARESLSRLRTTGTSSELELLYGLPAEPLLEIARTFNVAVRMYVPYGHAGVPYRLKESIRNPRVLAWFLRDLRKTILPGTLPVFRRSNSVDV